MQEQRRQQLLQNVDQQQLQAAIQAAVQAAIQGEQVRVTGKKRDDLQQVISLLKDTKLELPLQYINFRD